jgi:hypothetical protein
MYRAPDTNCTLKIHKVHTYCTIYYLQKIIISYFSHKIHVYRTSNPEEQNLGRGFTMCTWDPEVLINSRKTDKLQDKTSTSRHARGGGGRDLGASKWIPTMYGTHRVGLAHVVVMSCALWCLEPCLNMALCSMYVVRADKRTTSRHARVGEMVTRHGPKYLGMVWGICGVCLGHMVMKSCALWCLGPCLNKALGRAYVVRADKRTTSRHARVGGDSY